MAKAKSPEALAAVTAAKEALKTGLPPEDTTNTAPTGFVESTVVKAVKNPPITDEAKAKKAADDAVLAEAKEAKAAQKLKDAEERQAKKEAADLAKAEKKTARDTATRERKERLAALAAEGRTESPMLALADKVKSGVYVKGVNGQLRSNDALAIALDGVAPTNVVRIGLDLLKLEDNPYAKLNVGQQSMNLRNRMRGAIKKDVFKLEDIAAYIERNKIPVTTAADTEAAAKAKADAKVKRESDAAAKKAEKAAKSADAAGGGEGSGPTE